MIKNKLLTTLVIVGMFSLTVEPYIASAQTPDGTSTSGASILLNENFDSAPSGGIPEGWSKTGFWGASYVGLDFGNTLYGDYTNLPYANNSSGTVTSPTFDLGGATNATIGFVTRCDTEYTPNTDYMTLQASGDNGTSFSNIMSWNEATIDTDTSPEGSAVRHFTDIAVPSNLLTSNFKLAFKWQADSNDDTGDGTGHDGCLIDDVTLTRNGGTGTTPPTDTGTTTPPVDTGTTTPPTGTTTPPTDNGTTTPGTGTTTPPTDNGTTTPGTGTTTPPTDTGTTTPPVDNSTTTPGTGTTTPPTTGNTYSLSACGPLNNEGVYNLLNDITATSTCFQVNVNNITLDGHGFTVTGTNAAGVSAVVASDKTGITIKNLKASNFDQAISLTSVSNSTFDTNTLNSNNYAFVLHGGNGNTIKNTIANNNQNIGIYVQNTTDTTISGNTTNNNAVGINLDSASGNTVTNNTANLNDRGILLLTSSNNTVQGNTANQNAFGIALETTSEHNTVSNNTQNGNGVGIAIGSGHNTFTGLHIDSSTSKAIRFYEGNSNDNVLNNIVVTNTGSDGYDVSFDAQGNNSGAAIVNGTIFNSSPLAKYVISSPGTFTVKNPYGSIEFLQGVSGSGANLANDLKIESGTITIASSSPFSAADMRITLNNTDATSSQLQKNGALCGDCSEFSNLANNISFRIHGAGIYSTTGITTPPTNTGTSTDNGTTTPGTGTTTPTDNGTTTPGTGTTTPGTGTTTPPTDNGTTTPGTGTTTPNDNATSTDSTGTTTPGTATSTDTATNTTTTSSGGGGGGGGGYYILTSSTPGSSDLNNDGRVDFVDFNILMKNWESFFTGVGDINNDLRVDLLDLSLLINNWSK